MVFLDESRLSWLSPLRRSTTERKASSGGKSEEKDCWRAFDIADDMEKGFARELVFDFTQPLPRSNTLWKFQVERSADRLQYRLYCNGGEFLMFAQLSRDGRRAAIFLYDPLEQENSHSLYDPDRPAFTLTDTSKDEWALVQDRCDVCRHAAKHSPRSCSCCQGRNEVMRVKHRKENVGDGVSHCMDVTFPMDDRWDQNEWDQNEQALYASTTSCTEQRLVTRLPIWNEKLDSLVLDFTGRQVLASAKNFQLVPEDATEQPVLQYAKIGSDSFGLDFRYPLTVVQAFAASLTTLHWA